MGVASSGGNGTSRPVEEILDTIGDRYARDVLACICEKDRSAREVAASIDHSIQTVYRRLGVLEEHGLVETRTKLVGDGNHYQVYGTTFESVLISVEDEAYDIEICRQGSVPDRFSELWDDLSRR